jgi:NADH:ubiquinone oxidoreductase subunit C
MNVKAWILGGAPARRDTPAYKNSVQEFLPIADVRDGVVITRDGRYVKILEVLPVNFYLKSYTEQQNIIYYFSSYLKIAPDNLQIRVLTQKADIGAYTQRMWGFFDAEENPHCQDMITDNVNMVHFLAHSEAVTRRFFLVFSLEPQMKVRGNEFRDIAARLREEAETARRYLDFCGLEILQWDAPDDALINLFYELLNKTTSKTVKLDRPSEMVGTFAFESENIIFEGETQI